MENKAGNPATEESGCQLTKKVETYVLDGCNTSGIPLPHDCVITGIREEDDYLVIDFEDGISCHDSIQSIHPDALTLTVRFHLKYGGLNGVKAYGGLQGIYRHRRSKGHGEGYMRIKNLRKLQKLIKGCSFPATYLYQYLAYHQVIVELCVDDSTLLMLWADSVDFEWTLKDRS